MPSKKQKRKTDKESEKRSSSEALKKSQSEISALHTQMWFHEHRAVIKPDPSH